LEDAEDVAVEIPAQPVSGSIKQVARRRWITLPSWWVSLRERLPWRRSQAVNRALGATSTVVFVAALVTGAVFRALHLMSYAGGINSDEAVVYLMARHAQHWQFQAFYWREQYGGTLLEDVTGLVFHVTGPHIIVLQVVEAAFFLAAVLMMWALVRRVIDRRTANVAAALLWLAPLGVFYSVHDPGYSSAGLACAFATLFAASSYNGEAWRTAVVGVLFGLSWWTTPLALLIAWPALIFLWPARRKPRQLLLLVAGFFVGALPWLWRNVGTHFASTHVRPGHSTLLHRTREAVTVLAPAGLDPFGHLWRTHGTAVGYFAFGALLAGIVIALLMRRVMIAALLFSGLMWPVLVARTGFPVVPSAMRYAVFLLPALALLAGLVARRLSVVAVGALAYSTVVVLGSLLYHVPYDPRHSRRIAEVATVLSAQHRTHIWSTYWIAYVLDAETQERVTAASVVDDRYQPYRKLADSAPTTVLVRAAGPDDRALAAVSGGRRTLFGAFALWTWRERISLPPLGNN
jgi:hypothetical protein